MRKKMMSFLMAAALLAAAVPVSVQAEDPEQKSNFLMEIDQQETVPEGYTGIYTAEDMKRMEDEFTGSFILMEDIELDESFAPLCQGEWEFKGEFDGNGHVIRGLNIQVDSASDAQNLGIFAQTRDAEIRNLAVEGQISAGAIEICSIGGIVGSAWGDLDIENCVSDVDIVIEKEETSFWGNHASGGLVGICRGSGKVFATYCRNLGDITIPDAMVGGIIGYIRDQSVMMLACLNEGNIVADTYLGGIVGNTDSADFKMSSCVNRGDITIEGQMGGGLVGNTGMGEIVRDCLNMGDIFTGEALRYCGGIAGMEYQGQIINNLNVGDLEGEKCGSIVGSTWQPQECLGVYYYSSDHPTYAECSQDHAEGTDKYGYITEEQMSKQETYMNFDFDETWTMVEFLGHPYPTALVSNLVEEPQEEDAVLEEIPSEDKAEGNQPAESKPGSTEQKEDAGKGSGAAPILVVAGVAAVGAGAFFGMKKMKK